MKVNNGYCFLIHYQKATPRVFGPYTTTQAALFACLKFLETETLVFPEIRREMQKASELDRVYRPIVSKAYVPVYKTLPAPQDRISHVSIETLENPELFDAKSN